MNTAPVLEYLKKHGQLMDTDIATATGISLRQVQQSLSELSAQGEISQCSITRYNDGKPVVGVQCRIRGYIPPAAPGRKPGQ